MLAKVLKRLRRKSRIRATISWTSVRPRLSVFRSNKSIYAQIIDDVTGNTICSSSDLKIEKSTTKVEMAKKVWEDIAKKANSANITTVVFDRGGFVYHGRVKALADAAREAWLNF
jgi:large subunit ribosomal protein L18